MIYTERQIETYPFFKATLSLKSKAQKWIIIGQRLELYNTPYQAHLKNYVCISQKI